MSKPSHRKVPNTNIHKYQNQAYTQKQQEKPKCYRCGKTDHPTYGARKCPATGQTYQNCKKMGHFVNAFRFPKQYAKKINATVDTIGQENNAENVYDNQDNSETDFAFCIHSVNKNTKNHIMVEIIINGKPILMQVDTTADVSIMSEKTAESIPNLLLEGTNRVLKGYNGFDIQVIGASNVEVQYKEQKLEGMPLTVVKGKDVAHRTKRNPVFRKVLESLRTDWDLCGKEENCKPYKDIWFEA
ncbi:uncharacterized protein [Palaemon carinicauda]|uniref:uncharacterized protein n=1 Tax=Palaemon carinicauda TaxID=392227 RepID=UPI0035B660E5